MISYEAALAELQSMFGDFDRDVLASVLHANRGHMEKTIDSLLQMKGEKPINSDNAQAQSATEAQDQIARDEALARALQQKILAADLAARGISIDEFLRSQQMHSGRPVRYVPAPEYSSSATRPSQAPSLHHSSPTASPDYTAPPPRRATPPQQYRYAYDDDDFWDADLIDLTEVKEKMGQLGSAAKMKCKLLMSKVKLPSFGPKTGELARIPSTTAPATTTSTHPTHTSSSETTSNAAASKEHDADDAEVVAFDSSLVRRPQPDVKHGSAAALFDDPPPLPPVGDSVLDDDDTDTKDSEKSSLIDRRKYPKKSLETKKDQ